MPCARRRGNRSAGPRGGQTKVDAPIDRSRVDGGGRAPTTLRADAPRRDRLVDSALLRLRADRRRRVLQQPGAPGRACRAGPSALGTLGGLAACVRAVGPPALAGRVCVAILPVAVLTSFAAPAGLIAFFTVARAPPARGRAVDRRARADRPVDQLRGRRRATAPSCGPSCGSSLLSIVLLHVAVAALGHVRARPPPAARVAARARRARRGRAARCTPSAARDHERARIAREMHDVLAHRISLLSMHAGSLEFRPDAPPEEIARAAGVIRDERPCRRSRTCAR